MKRLILSSILSPLQEKNKEFNLSRTQVGYPLRTLKGSTIGRSCYGVGKVIGNKIYMHKDYFQEAEVDSRMFELLQKVVDKYSFDYNVIRFDLSTRQIAAVECPDFDTAREPVVGKMLIVNPDGSFKETRFFNQIYHHKWIWVKNNYTGFDVADSWEWSRKWLSVLTEPADGSNIANWNKQLRKFNLQ